MTRYATFSLLMIAAAVFVAPPQVAARCNVCNANGIACISGTQFNLCFNGDRDTAVYSCPQGQICTDRAIRCVDEATVGVEAACPSSSTCGECVPTQMFACTSRTTFVQCNGTEPIEGTNGRCPEGLTCAASKIEICVDNCNLPETLDCTNEADP